jgi:hypothetical protein
MGGRSGGWDPRDHDSFLKVLTAVQAHGGYNETVISSRVARGGGGEPPGYDEGEDEDELHVISGGGSSSHNGERRDEHASVNPLFVAKFVNFLPGKTVTEIEEHILWYGNKL